MFRCIENYVWKKYAHECINNVFQILNIQVLIEWRVKDSQAMGAAHPAQSSLSLYGDRS